MNNETQKFAEDVRDAALADLAELREAEGIIETAEGWALQIEGPGEPKEGERKANRKERRDYIRSLPRHIRLAYGFGKIDHGFPGKFVAPAKPR